MTEIAAETIDVDEVETPPEQTFADLGVAEPIVAALADSGITTPFPCLLYTSDAADE